MYEDILHSIMSEGKVGSWIFSNIRLRHKMFLAFIECKIEGDWTRRESSSDHTPPRIFDYLYAQHPENCLVHIIEPDGLRRIFHFNQGSTLNAYQNIISYNPDEVQEIIVDEKEQAGKGKIRDKLT